jgi:flagellar assembly protein FliH
MAKLIKNALISSECVSLGNQETTLSDTTTYIESLQPLINESQLELFKQESYQQGYLSGQAEEKNRVDQEMALLKHQLETALQAIPQSIASNRLSLSNEIADIVLSISQQFFIEKESNPQILEHQINQLLNQLNSKQTIELCVHPQELNILQKGVIKLEASHLNSLIIKSDDTLSLGGYRLKTEHGMFDASIEKQIDKLKEFLLEIRQRGQHAALD